MLYDLTSSYFEGHCCPLAQRGHSRDGKKGTAQIVFGLLCTADGFPVAVEVFSGHQRPEEAQVIRHRFGLKRVVLVGDRGMLTGARIREDAGHRRDALDTLRAPTIRKLSPPDTWRSRCSTSEIWPRSAVPTFRASG